MTRRLVRPLRAFAAAVLLVLSVGAARAAEVERVVSPGGVEAWLVRDHLNPIVSMRFAFRGGSALDPVGRTGLASMTASLLDEGAGDLDSKAFQQELEDLSITLRFEAGLDQFGGRLRTLTDNLERAFELLRLAVTQPRFDAEPVARLRAQILAGLRQEQEEPQAIAGKAMMKALYPDHPYGNPAGGTIEGVQAIAAEDLKDFVARRLARDALVIGVVGDITPERLALLLDKTFGGLPAKAAAWDLPPAAPSDGPRTIVVERPISQAAILFSDHGIKRKDPDFYAAYVLNHILGGGGFTSRLYSEVREKRGLAYSVYTYLHPMDFSALISGGAGTANDRAAETLKVVRDEWRRMAENGVTAAELDDAKRFLTGSFPLRFTSSDRIASMLVGMQLDDLGMDYIDRRNGLIRAVDLRQVNRVARNLLRPARLTFVVVGEPKDVAATR